MQIRLTVVDPLGPSAPAQGRAPRSDVLVTAPAGTALAAVASALAQVVSGGDGSGTVVLYAGEQRLDAQRCTLGEPPLTDGAVLSVGAPGEPEPHPELDGAPAQLQVVAGPDAGGVHLLHGGEIRIGRSADADVPLDDPDVSRLHCAVTVGADGRVAVADLDSTNGTTLDGRPVSGRAVRFAPGALLRIGESALRLAPAGGPGARVGTTPDGEGHVRVPGPAGDGTPAHPRATNPTPAGPSGPTRHAYGSVAWSTPGPAGQGSGDSAVVPGQGGAPRVESRGAGAAAEGPGSAGRGTYPGTEEGRPGPGGRGRRVSRAPGDRASAGFPDDSTRAAAREGTRPPSPDGVARAPRQRGAAEGSSPMASPDGPAHASRQHDASPTGFGEGDTHAGRFGTGALGGAFAGGGTYADRGAQADGGMPAGGGPYADGGADGAGRAGGAGPRAGAVDGPASAPAGPGPDARAGGGPGPGAPASFPDEPSGRGRKGTPLRGTDIPQGARRRGGLGAWARRLTGGRGEQGPDPREVYGDEPAGGAAERSAVVPAAPETWPDPATLLLTALGPGPRLWERGPGHPEALAVRLGTADRAVPDGSGLLPAVPVTAGLREAGALGLAGPRARLGGLARALLAQLTALHSPDMLEIVLIAADRSRPLEERTAEWSWLGWLPHVRPGHGQDCRLLLAHDREQAAARTDELLRRLEDQLAETGTGSAAPLTSTPLAPTGEPSPGHLAPEDYPGTDASVPFPGPFTVLVVDGDPGGADLREAVARLAAEGPRAGIHVVCLAETAAASPASPVTETYEAACAVSPTFRQCGAVALLSGDVATALRLMRVARAGAGSAPAGHGTVATVDAVSPAWAERFARALAPLRTDAATSERQPRVSAPLPQAARLLDELGLARATPASLMARWADAADDADALGGRVRAVLGAGPRGPVGADLAAQGPHLLIEGPPGSGRTELLRAVVASLAAAERPDRLGIVLVDGRGGPGAGGGHGEGLRVCTDVPHVTTHLSAHDPVRMREFAQSLSAELKRRAELLGRSDFAEWHSGRELSGRMVAQRTATARGGVQAETAAGHGAGDLDSPSSSTMRLRPRAARRQTEAAAPPLPRLVVVVDDLDALVSPALGSTGRPAAGSVMRALEAVAREGERLGVHLVTASGPCPRTAETEPARRATLRVALEAPAPGPDEPAPGRGRLTCADGRVTPLQGGRVTGRIPRTATLRPTVVPLEWHRMGDPPARRPVRELGNGPTDLALLASALERAAREVSAVEVPSLL
ncbi:FtsK/SpoIIIE domain-containing protein [Streptomyces violarus]|uniref:PSer/pThr/pTyr-binding forkhead associated (FHA) protein n=1 Tax=Streptomyces violarus TaxID=67380 RepID=A0A7W5F2E4_9ACTN|nr:MULTISPECIES: FHA domain-containing protein [Streptomyces]MBB3077520.1 pSer/pThr/pTyr-binding forkhead associated (FHA) protein [Streptomyces violarus]WRU00860.1 FHA domain-containing protein [Streptomyces sp. CGMCC 4.1772]